MLGMCSILSNCTISNNSATTINDIEFTDGITRCVSPFISKCLFYMLSSPPIVIYNRSNAFSDRDSRSEFNVKLMLSNVVLVDYLHCPIILQ